jgi:arylsulfatase A-like enzyme
VSAPLVIVFVVDGLRPDAVTTGDTPTIDRLRSEGVEFVRSHAVVPTVTRVNATTLVTGAHPGTHGIVGNQIFVPGVDPGRAIDTASHRRLLDVDRVTNGRLVMAPTLAERLAATGLTFAAVSSGSTGSALLTNHRAPAGVGVLVNGYFDTGARVAWPDEANEAILSKLGPAPAKDRGTASYDRVVTWTQRALREYVLPEVHPAAVINWITEPDHSQHVIGVGSPAARAALRHADGQIAETLTALGELGLADSTDIIVVSDHGFTTNAAGVDVTAELLEAKLADSGATPEVVLASSGQAVALHVAGRQGDRVERIARFLLTRDWAGALFTAARAPGDPRGVVEGTFSLGLAHLANPERSPDILLTFPWTSRANAFGVAGADLACVSGGAQLFASDHGSMSPWNVRNTLIAWGPHFKRSVKSWVPAGNVDVAPTVLALLGVGERAGMEGRVLREALADGPDPEHVPVDTRTHIAEAGSYRAALQLSVANGRHHVDKSWRLA